jgi:hypothetical protein
MADERPMNKQQLDALFAHLLPFAHQTLEKYGEFFPFGASLGKDGQLRPVMGHTGSDRPPSQELIDLIRSGFQMQRASLVAVGTCYDVRIRPRPDAKPQDAICISLEHEDGLTLMVFEPYSKHGTAITYASAFAEPGQARVFALPRA